ncbi:MAG: futalosine hydrolase [Nitrospirae bacterium]|nr:futalosine hydrolase [Nitrospirota bacterium]
MVTKGIGMVGLISAVSFEGDGLIKKPVKVAGNNSPLSICSGRISGVKVIHAVPGLGKVNASHAATVLIKEYPLSLIINFGVGGAYPRSGLTIGDVAFATKEVYADEGVLLGKGLKTLDEIGIPVVVSGGREYFNEFPLDQGNASKIVDSIVSAKRPGRHPIRIKKGPFATVSACTGTSERGRQIEKKYGVICENMEGAAVAQICVMYKVPMIEVRGISNVVEERDRKKWDLDKAAANCRIVLAEFFEAMGGTPD